ncbi:MAG: peptidoglycan editing factor PgeF [Clostridiales bacterium]|nr:peptidoglycan editing factor PgeF [Clostridium sp.]MDD5877794.1 peptidoglycan editing factor PgeF [Clostridiales bacterium]
MENYIKVDRIEKELDFVNLVITTTNIDAKNEDDLFKTFSKDEFNLTNLTRNSQIHSSIVNKIDEKNIGQRIDGDALISNVKEVPLLILTADCVPVVIIDPKNKAVGVAHAGWRGTYDKICKNTIDEMIKNYKSNPEDLICVIGPSIGPCCYEVSKDLVEKFNTNLANHAGEFDIIKDDKYFLDLWKINELTLKDCNVKDENIINLQICTNCNHDKFYSYRKHNKTPKRIGTMIQIK